MKLAVIKLGGRINGNADGAVGGEVLVAIDLLVRGDNNVHFFTNILKKDVPLKGATGHQIEDFNPRDNYDALVVINGNINYYGGQEPELEMQNLKLLNSFPGKVFYFMFDPMLPLKQHWDGVSKKQEKYNWKNKYSKQEIEIVRDDITVISQPYALDEVKKIWDKSGIKVKDIIHYPLYKMHLVYYDRLPLDENITRNVDLLYGGTFRNKKREDKLIKYYFGYPDDFNVEIFGKIELNHFTEKKILGLRPPTFTGQVKATEMRSKMSSGYATVIIGDKWYEGKNLAQRIYESILANTVTLVDAELDPHRLVYGDRMNTLYVNSKDNVKEVIDFIKFSDGLKRVCDLQYDLVYISKQKYVNDLRRLLEDNV